ncbi:uncharacterized protein LOC103718037 isoform X3 [Phoenix dactylifera]|nr:uncharacterized protein LOC103718037 isoform X3 [Phoenix dactylifera]
MLRKKCRLWWPEQLLSSQPNSNLLLFGWYICSVNSLDIIVATAISPHEISPCLLQSSLQIQEILHSVNGAMPLRLQDLSTISILGHCTADCTGKVLKLMGTQNNDSPRKSNSERLECPGVEENSSLKTHSDDRVNQQCHQKLFADTSDENCARWNCGCKKLDQFTEPHRQSFIRNGNWIQVLCKSQRILCKEIPELHHMHLNGDTLSAHDVHLIIYELPTYGRNHFSLSSWGSSGHVGSPFKKPNWVNELDKKPMLLDLDSVMLALNCATAAKVLLEQHMGTFDPVIHLFWISTLVSTVWQTMAVLVASVATARYILLQALYRFLSYGSQTFFFILSKMFAHTWKNVHIRSCQFLYWPVILQGTGFSSQSNVEYAHRSALRKHFMWSNVAMDVIFGIIIGLALLANAEAVCFWILIVVRGITDNLLRLGCVWLMGVPAGFKLNTELAELLGMISLNAIQIFSTLCFFLSTYLSYFVEGLALSGIVFGLTVPAALCIDMLKLATLHVLTLHWLISFLYSQQIQALASLWRLFRGRKWNPLRQRLDSYDYTVEQHVVGSLLFTPLLLLLPTTSVFYIFFTMLSTTITFICIMIEITISVLHATPLAEILLWIAQRRRFPSGIWFEIISGPTACTYAGDGLSGDSLSSDLDARKTACFFKGGSKTLVSLLRSNYATIGKIIAPHYRNIFCGVRPSFGPSLAYGVLSGQRIPSTLQTSLPPTLPWMNINFREYWRLCHDAVLSFRL